MCLWDIMQEAKAETNCKSSTYNVVSTVFATYVRNLEANNFEDKASVFHALAITLKSDAQKYLFQVAEMIYHETYGKHEIRWFNKE
jgi:hypothetical protein